MNGILLANAMWIDNVVEDDFLKVTSILISGICFQILSNSKIGPNYFIIKPVGTVLNLIFLTDRLVQTIARGIL